MVKFHLPERRIFDEIQAVAAFEVWSDYQCTCLLTYIFMYVYLQYDCLDEEEADHFVSRLAPVLLPMYARNRVSYFFLCC